MPSRHRTYWDADEHRQITVDLTADEELARDAEEAQFATEKAEAQAAEKARVENAAAGRQKLIDLGLSESEIDALIGNP